MLFGPWVERPGGGKRQVFLQAALGDCQPPHPARPVLSAGAGRLSRLPAQAIAARGIPTLHGQRQDLPLPAVGPHRHFHRHPHRAHPSLSTRRTAARSNVSSVPCANSFMASLDPKVLLSSNNSTSVVALARHRLPPPRTQFSPDHTAAALGSAISNRFASFRRPPIYAVCSFIAWTGWCAKIPPSC